MLEQITVLRRHLEELAMLVIGSPFGHRAAHVPGQDAQLGDARRVDPSRVDRDVDRLAEIALGVAGQGALEEQLPGGEVGQEVGDLVAVVPVHVAEIVQGEG